MKNNIADIAETQIGNHEDGESNTGSLIAKYQAATELGVPARGHGWPWCCAFVDWCCSMSGQPTPRTASVSALREWGIASKDVEYIHANAEGFKPRRGDIVLFRFPTGNHVGIVTGGEVMDSHEPKIPTVEGNTSGRASGDQRNGGEVAAKLRNWLNVWCFLRLK